MNGIHMTIAERVEAFLYGDVRHREGDFMSIASEVLNISQAEVDAALATEKVHKRAAGEDYTVSTGLMDLIYRTLMFYASRTSYAGQRTGGVLKGCPRGPAPTPEQLIRYAQDAVDRIEKEVLKR